MSPFKNHLFKAAAAAVLVTMALAARASDADDFRARLTARFPSMGAAKIAEAFPGFHSVIKGSEILYVRDDLSVLIPGDVIDLRTNQSLTAALRAANKPHISAKDLETRDAIKIGTGSRRLYVFSDPDCTFCRQLEPELAKLHDVQVFVFPFPLVGLHPNARVVAETIWCQPDRAAAWRQYLLTNIAPTAATCDNPISRNLALADKLQIQGTPALIFEDGTVIPGAISAERIEAQLAAVGRK